MAPAHGTGLGGGRSCCMPWKHPTSSGKFTPALARPLTCGGPTSSGKVSHSGRSSRKPLGPASPWSLAPRGLLSPTLLTGAEWSHQPSFSIAQYGYATFPTQTRSFPEAGAVFLPQSEGSQGPGLPLSTPSPTVPSPGPQEPKAVRPLPSSVPPHSARP